MHVHKRIICVVWARASLPSLCVSSLLDVFSDHRLITRSSVHFERRRKEIENERHREIEYWMCIMKKRQRRRRMLHVTTLLFLVAEYGENEDVKKRCFFPLLFSSFFFFFFSVSLIPYLYVPIIITMIECTFI